jgi:hypothetical protein
LAVSVDVFMQHSPCRATRRVLAQVERKGSPVDVGGGPQKQSKKAP